MDEYDERFRRYEEILAGLARMLAAQHEMNQRFEGFIQHQDTINERLTLAIERIDRTLAHVEITQARMETLLARMFPTGENGRDA
jgi:hypothetical protein